jgi:hypothetical protein
MAVLLTWKGFAPEPPPATNSPFALLQLGVALLLSWCDCENWHGAKGRVSALLPAPAAAALHMSVRYLTRWNSRSFSICSWRCWIARILRLSLTILAWIRFCSFAWSPSVNVSTCEWELVMPSVAPPWDGTHMNPCEQTFSFFIKKRKKRNSRL